MARAKWNLVFSLMSIPVKLVKIAKPQETRFKEYHDTDGCGNRLGRKTICNVCSPSKVTHLHTLIEKVKDKKLKEELEQGTEGIAFELPKDEKGKGVCLTNKKDEMPIQFSGTEREALHPMTVPAETIQILNFIDPLPAKWHNGSNYKLIPQDNNPQWISLLGLLYKGLQKSGKVALVKYWDSNTEYNAVLTGDGLLYDIYYYDEVGEEDELKAVMGATLDKKMTTMMDKLIKQNTKPFKPETELRNSYREDVLALAHEKQNTGKVTIGKVVSSAPKVDPKANIMNLLSQIDKVTADVDKKGKKAS